MFNDTINSTEIFERSMPCENGTICGNKSDGLGNDIDFELIENCRYYLEGIALTPISVFGILGRQ